MFTQFKNIDTAFKHIKSFSYLFLLGNVLIVCFGLFLFARVSREQAQRVYILYNGKVLQAFASERKGNLPVELRDHIKTFHQYFFTLSPDDKAIAATIGKALYLADESAKRAYDNLREQGFYNNLISANISQQIEVDSVKLDVDSDPYAFTCFARQKLVRTSGSAFRKLVTRGRVRVLQQQSDDNPHGFLIQRWEILENRDVAVNP
ncbi:MAG: conjugative transposon protein TraK [Candidatus Pedobacter colombiensis]|uniref:Conjugative transposon protein TraK n=1 Tax=Candidatus Pedobacter colombiensis TaxID=3121371 RepID=A0AAJ5W9H1_9SPHI|nr:conjugative transposon protein TraK [Pedobacter sp.]WEK20436.1 MAG: conjugative transposon protein TraK [Pedobacter sp.]